MTAQASTGQRGFAKVWPWILCLAVSLLLLANAAGCGRRDQIPGNTIPRSGDVGETRKPISAEEQKAAEAIQRVGVRVNFNFVLSGADARELYGIDKPMTEVYMTDVQDINSVLKELRPALKVLPDLKLHTQGVNDVGLEQLKDLKNLVWLDLREPDVSDQGLAHVVGLDNLRYLAVPSKKLTIAGCEHIGRLSKLCQLYYGDNFPVDDFVVAHLGKLTQLRTLRLEGRKDHPVTDAGLAHLKGLTALRELRLSSSAITDAGLANLAGLTSLQALSLFDCDKLNGSGLAHLQGLTNLNKLDIHQCYGLQPGNISHLSALKGLKEMSVDRSLQPIAYKELGVTARPLHR